MTQPIRIHHADTDDEAYERHKQIEDRLEHFGIEQVRAMMGHGLPTNWNPIIIAWLRGDRLEEKKLEPKAPEPGEPKDGSQ